MALESYTNVEDPQQRADFLDLAQRPELRFLFCDRALRHRLTRTVRNADPQMIVEITQTADQLRATIPMERFDFDRAKAAVMVRTSL